MKIFSITGWSGCGKTTLISNLVKKLKSQDKKVLATKNAKHKFYVEPETTDTFKFMEAGADEVFLVTQNQLLSMTPIPQSSDIIQLLKSHHPDADFLLLEGLTAPGIPIIEVFNSSTHDTMKFSLEKLSAIISAAPLSSSPGMFGSLPVFHPDEIDRIILFMEEYHE